MGQLQLLYVVANYVFSLHWSLRERQVSKRKQIRVTFRIHPYLASRTSLDMLIELRRLVALQECITVSEIDIGMTTACDCRQPCSQSTATTYYCQSCWCWPWRPTSPWFYIAGTPGPVRRINMCCRRLGC